MRVRRSLQFSNVILAGCIALIACGESTSPTLASVAGGYEATALTTTIDGTTTNQLAEGTSVSVFLAQNGTTSGTLFVPEGNDDGTDLTASLAGTWTLNGNTVEFDHAADTFIRDMPFTVQGNNRLVGDHTFFGDTRIQITLTKTLVAARETH